MHNNDRNFNDIAALFTQNIYGTTKGKLRQLILWQDLTVLLAQCPDRPLTILDAGAGEGRISCALAAMGHHVIHCDISEKMIGIAQGRAQQNQTTDHMTFICTPIQQIKSFIDSPPDLIICHAMLEWIADPYAVLALFSELLAAGGRLSLMFYNYYGSVFQNITNGNLSYVELGMPKKKRRTLSPDFPLKPEIVDQYLNQLHFSITQRSGIRVFHDYMKDKTIQQQHFDTLEKLEKRYCREEPYIHYARYIHVCAKKNE